MQRLLQHLGIGLRTYGEAWTFIRRHNLWSYFIWPFLFSLLIFWIGDTLIGSFIDLLGVHIREWFGGGDTDGGFWQKWTLYATRIILKLLFFYLYYSINKYLVFIVLSPVLALITEHVEKKATGRDFPFSFSQFVADVSRGIAIAFRNLFLEYLITILLGLLSFIPPFVLVTPFIIFFIQSYFYGFAFLDYTSERRRLNLKQSVAFIRKHKGVAIGNGIVFSLIFLVPVLGGIIAPILSAVAATLAYLKIERQDLALPHDQVQNRIL